MKEGIDEINLGKVSNFEGITTLMLSIRTNNEEKTFVTLLISQKGVGPWFHSWDHKVTKTLNKEPTIIGQ